MTPASRYSEWTPRDDLMIEWTNLQVDEQAAAASERLTALNRAAEVTRSMIAAEIEAFADDHSDVSDAYRHAALIAKGTPGP